MCLFVLTVYLNSRRRAVAFLHPYCEMGGGGEVVLWKAVDAIAKEIRKCVVCPRSFYF